MIPVAITGGLQTPLAALLAGVVAWYLWTADATRRAVLGVAVLALAPLTLAASVIGDDEASLQRVGLPLIVLAVIAGGLLVVALAAAFVRWPRAVVPVALVALPFRVPIALGGASVKLLLPLYLTVAAAVLALAWQSRRRPAPAEVRGRRRLDIALGGVVLLYGLQVLYSSDPAVGAQNLAFFYAPFALLYGIASRERWDRELVDVCLKCAAVTALVLVGVGFAEYLRGEYLITPGGIQPNDFDPYFRIQSLFFDPNIFGRFLVVVMVLVATALLRSRGAARVGAYAAVLAVLWAGLVLTLSQSSFLALLAGLAVIAALEWGIKRVAIATGALALAAVLLAVLLPSTLKIDLGSERGLESTTSGRFDLVTGGFELWRERPLLGSGSGSFAEEFVSQQLAAEDGAGESSTSKSHTAPLTVAAEQGVVGFVALLLLLWVAFATVFAGAARGFRPGVGARIAVAAAFTAIFVHSLTYASFLEDPLTWMLLGCALGLGAIPRRGGEQGAEPAEGASMIEAA